MGKGRRIIMRYIGTAVTDIGISKKTNQDSVCIKVADTKRHGQIVMAIICDGMGGLSKGELASATLIRVFESWFVTQLPQKLENLNLEDVAGDWDYMIKEQNYKILEYGKKIGANLGTTFTGMLIADNKYVIVHVGDTRVYRIGKEINQITEDQTFIARELKKGTMTPEQAKTDSRRNMLLQCVGASRSVSPDILYGTVTNNTIYMLCSDGFRHVLTEQEIYEGLNPLTVQSADKLTDNAKILVNEAKKRKEKDNITVALIKSI